MPHSLINKLRRLDTFKLPKTVANLNRPIESNSELDERVFEIIDDIALAARNVFGARLEPTVRQETILRENGILITKGDCTFSIWKTGVIHTPFGTINYR